MMKTYKDILLKKADEEKPVPSRKYQKLGKGLGKGFGTVGGIFAGIDTGLNLGSDLYDIFSDAPQQEKRRTFNINRILAQIITAVPTTAGFGALGHYVGGTTGGLIGRITDKEVNKK